MHVPGRCRGPRHPPCITTGGCRNHHDSCWTATPNTWSRQSMQPIIEVAAGVPFVALPPAERSEDAASLVVVWHMTDAPRSERAMAAALPLNGLRAWRVYLGLPLCGSRLPVGGLDEFFRLGYEDAVLNLFEPMNRQA